MHATVNSQVLMEELRLLNKIAPTKATLPILQYALVRAHDQQLSLYGTDLEVGLLATCPAVVTMPGVMTIPVTKLVAMVDQFPNAEVTFTLQGTHVHLTCGAFASRLQTLESRDYPAIPEVTGVSATLTSLTFRQMLTRVRYAISEGGSAFVTKGALLTLADATGACLATDGKRLAIATTARAGASFRITIPTKAVDLLLSQLESGKVTITNNERHLFFATTSLVSGSSRILLSRTLEATFPSLDRVVPDACETEFVMDRFLLMAALKRVGLASDQDQSVMFRVAKDLHLSARNVDIGDAQEVVTVVSSRGTDGMQFAANWHYILDFLEVASGQTVTLGVKDTRLLLTDGDHHLGVVMLMKV